MSVLECRHCHLHSRNTALYNMQILFSIRSFFILFLIVMCAGTAFTQRQKEDSLRKLLAKPAADTHTVIRQWQLADQMNKHTPDTALYLAQRALSLAQQLGYTEGESRSLGVLANTLIKLGNYPTALDYYLRKLQIEETRNMPRNLASVVMNIGVVYMFQQEYREALRYYLRADSLIEKFSLNDIRYNSALNIGDLYDRMQINDSAYLFFSKSLMLATAASDSAFMATSMVGLGHSTQKQQQYDRAAQYYYTAIPMLQNASDNDLLCEAYLGLARLFQRLQRSDSAIYFATQSFELAQKVNFPSRALDAAQMLTALYKNNQRPDSAFAFLERATILSDSINSRQRVRQMEMLSTNEQLRQQEAAINRMKAQEERSKQLQYLFISIFIPLVFLCTFFLSKRKIHTRVIRFMGIISLLILFEFLTLLLHPLVAELTHHNPVYELLIFVSIASLLIPAHHRLEHWIIEKLTNRPAGTIPAYMVRLKTLRLKIKKPTP